MFYLISTLGAVTVLFVVFRRRYASSISNIPGPFLASFSNFWQIWTIVKGDIDHESTKLHDRYGPFVRISHEEVSVCHPDAIRKILLSPLHKSDWYSVIALPDQRFQTPMSELDPRRHAQRSKHLAAGFSMTHVLKSEPHVSSSILRLKSRLHEFAQSTAEVHLDHWFNYLAFDIIGEVVFSSSFGFLDAGRDLGGSIANNRFLSLYVAIAGFFQNVHRMTVGNPIVSDRKLMPTQHIFDTTLTAIDARQKNPGVRRDVLSLWMEQRAANGDSFSEKELYGCVNMTVGAGADTVSASLQSFFYHIIRHPRMLERVRKEIGDAGLTEDVVSYADAAGLPFLMACIKEAWRLFPPVSFPLSRVVGDAGLTVGGQYFAPGTKLSVNPRVIHHSRAIFGADAAAYNPERWLGPDAKELDRQFVAFGAGYNSCQGKNIAQLEIYKTIATLVRDFDFAQVDPGQEWKYDAYFTATPYDWPCRVRAVKSL